MVVAVARLSLVVSHSHSLKEKRAVPDAELPTTSTWNWPARVGVAVALRPSADGTTVTDATTLCTDQSVPWITVTLSATATTSTAMFSQSQVAYEFVRIR